MLIHTKVRIMTYDIAVIGSTTFVLGFKLGGVKEAYEYENLEENKVEINKVVEEVLYKKELGIVIMEESAFKLVKEVNKDKIIASTKPLFFILSKDKKEDESLRLMMKRALGTDMSIK